MALADMLSAMRGVILDGLALPNTVEEREQLLQRSFPGLSLAEAKDLALINPDKFSIYTGTIFRGEASLLKRLFPLCFEVMKNSWEECFGEAFNAYHFTKSLHQARPWKDSTTLGLAQSFVSYSSHDVPNLLAIAPALPELAAFELASLRILRTLNITPVNPISLQAIQTLSVEQLLELHLRKLAPTECFCSNWNLADAKVYFQRHETLLGFSFLQGEFPAIGSRDSDNNLHWSVIPSALFTLLASKNMDSVISLEEFALAAIENCAASSEEEQFRYFFDLLAALLECGAYYVFSNTS